MFSLIEIAPIRVSPLQWVGKRLNKEANDQIEKIGKKLDEHIAQSLRSKILQFQDDVINNVPKTVEQWKEVVHAIDAYEAHCRDNGINNGLCKQASKFLLKEYQKKLNNH